MGNTRYDREEVTDSTQRRRKGYIGGPTQYAQPQEGLRTGGLSTGRLSSGGLSSRRTGGGGGNPSDSFARQRRSSQQPGTDLVSQGVGAGRDAMLAGAMSGGVSGVFAGGLARRIPKPVAQATSVAQKDAIAAQEGNNRGGLVASRSVYGTERRLVPGLGAQESRTNSRGEQFWQDVIPTLDESHELRTPGWLDATPDQRKEILQPGAVDERGNEVTYGPNGLQVRGYDPAKDQKMKVANSVDPFEPNNWTRTMHIDPRYGGGVAQATKGGGHTATADKILSGVAKASKGKVLTGTEQDAFDKLKKLPTKTVPWLSKR